MRMTQNEFLNYLENEKLNPIVIMDYLCSNYSYNSKFRGSGFDGFTSDLVNLDSDRVIKIPDDFNLNVSAFIELISVAYQGINKFKQIAVTSKDALGVWGDGNLGFITSLLLNEIFLSQGSL